MATAPTGFAPLTGNAATAAIPGAPAPTTSTQKTAATVYDYNTGKPLAPGQAQSLYNTATGVNIQTGKKEPTVLGSTNIDQKNQDNTNKLTSMSQGGQVVGEDGMTRNADGSLANAPADSTPMTDENGNTYYSSGAVKYATASKVSDDPYVQSVFDQLSHLQGQMDATGSANIANIQAQYGSLIKEQQQVNKSQEAGSYALMLRGGSLQTESSSGIIQSQISAGVKSIADLIFKEQQAVIAAQQAAQDGDFKILDKQLGIASDARKERVAAAQKISEGIAAAKKALTERQQKVADKNRETTDKIAETAATNGAPMSVIKAIRDAVDPNEAYAAAGRYSAGGSGIIGEYNYAKANGYSGTFSDYQNEDANRKISIARAGSAGGLSSTTLTKVESIANQLDGEQVVKDYNTTATQVSYIQSLGKTPTDDMARVYAFAKVMDPNSVVRESEYKTVQDYAQAVIQGAGLKAKRIFENGGFLTDEARSFMNTTLTGRLKTQEKTYRNIYDEYGRRINKLTGSDDGTDYLTDYSKGYTNADEITNNDKTNQQAIATWVTQSPQNKSAYDQARAIFPNATTQELKDQLQIP